VIVCETFNLLGFLQNTRTAGNAPYSRLKKAKRFRFACDATHCVAYNNNMTLTVNEKKY
jgi:hypothetical protein